MEKEKRRRELRKKIKRRLKFIPKRTLNIKIRFIYNLSKIKFIIKKYDIIIYIAFRTFFYNIITYFYIRDQLLQ